jgi:hypothetical protein
MKAHLSTFGHTVGLSKKKKKFCFLKTTMRSSKRQRKPTIRLDPTQRSGKKKKKKMAKRRKSVVLAPPGSHTKKKVPKLKITFKATATTRQPPKKRKRKIKIKDAILKDELLMVCGEREYDLLYKDVGTMSVERGSREIEESDIPEEYDQRDPQDNSLVRTLDAFCLCDMNGVPVKIEEVFDDENKKKRVKIQAFGTVVRPDGTVYDTEDDTKGKDAQFQKVQREKRKSQKRIRVWIPRIVDWCFDYALGGNSKLWLISESGAWYV